MSLILFAASSRIATVAFGNASCIQECQQKAKHSFSARTGLIPAEEFHFYYHDWSCRSGSR